MLALLDSPYGQVTDELYSVWPAFKAAVPGARLGGFYAFKRGFHSSVEDNLEHWPGDYSIRDAINRRDPTDKARAIDLSLARSQMIRHTGYLRDAAAANDPRMRCVREFYGTLNGSTVFGRAHTGPDTAWRSSTADSSHTWHIHISIFTPYVDDLEAMAGLVSVLRGESLDDYLGGDSMSILGLRRGDSGANDPVLKQRILKLQYDLDNAGHDPGEKDAEYGPKVSAAVLACRKSMGSTAQDGDWITGAAANQIERALMRAEARKVAPPPHAPAPVDPEQLAAAVAAWLRENPPKDGKDGKTPTKVRVLLDADVVETA